MGFYSPAPKLPLCADSPSTPWYLASVLRVLRSHSWGHYAPTVSLLQEIIPCPLRNDSCLGFISENPSFVKGCLPVSIRRGGAGPRGPACPVRGQKTLARALGRT